jgi:peptide/nickel transport system substrate-binding protein
MKRNPHYWRTGKPYLDEIDFHVLTDGTSRANALASGDVDIILTNDTHAMADLTSHPDRRVVVDQTGDVEHIIMNQGQPPFDNTNARKALIYATDSQSLANELGNGLLAPADQPYYDKSAYYNPDSHYLGYNLDKAKQAVKQYETEAGHPLTFTFTISADPYNLNQAQILVDMWKKAGIDASIASTEATSLTQQIITGTLQATPGANFGFPDPDWNYIFWHSSFVGPIGQLSINMAHMSLGPLDDVLAQGRANLLPAERTNAYKRSSQIINDDDAYIWLYRTAQALIATDKVKGLGPAQTNGFARTDAKPWWDGVWLAD